MINAAGIILVDFVQNVNNFKTIGFKTLPAPSRSKEKLGNI